MSPDTRKDWRKICEQVLREKNPDRVVALLEELLEALEERARTRAKIHTVPSDS
jgi:pyruvate dehydrogenase complex dehydrogenase (E1) component